MKADKKLGLKITENADETMWHFQVEATKKEIDSLEKQLKINRAFLEKGEEMLKLATKKQ
jgi:hypothetical protein